MGLKRRAPMIALALAAGLTLPVVDAVAQNQAEPKCDFDGDGLGDLALGDNTAAVGGALEAGRVTVRYGTPSGLPGTADQVWHQDSAGIEGTASAGDRFGWTVGCGDFDANGFDDLVVGVPWEDVPGAANAGSVHVLLGSADGLSAAGNTVWHQDSPGVTNAAQAGDRFGHRVATGDFDGDGFDDLGIGVPMEDIGRRRNAGAVNVLYGSANGLSADNDQFWHQNRPGVKNKAQRGDRFGSALHAGDFDGSGHDDLVIGVPFEDVRGIRNAGAINVIYGSSAGLDAGPDDFWHQNRPGIKEAAAAGEEFGAAITVGDFDGNGRDDLAVGIPAEDRRARSGDGIVQVIYGRAGGLSAATDELWHQNRAGVRDVAESGDGFGIEVDAGDFDGDGIDDLAIGVAREDVGAVTDAGAVNVVYGSGGGLQASNDDFWHQDRPGVLSQARANERFGIGMIPDDFDGDGRADLLIAVFDLDPGLHANVLYGGGTGLTAADDQYLALE